MMRKMRDIAIIAAVAGVGMYLFAQGLQANNLLKAQSNPVKEQASDGVMTKERLLTPLPGDQTLGKSDAPITIIEYASLSCNHCAEFHKDVFPSIKEHYIDTGKAQFIYRDFPLNKQALRASMLAHCAGDRYFDFIKVLFKTQESWAFDKNFEEKLANIAKLGGMTGEQFDVCMQNVMIQEKVLESYGSAAKLLEIKGTPALFVNGTLVTNMGQEGMKAAIEGALGKGKQ